MAPKLGCLSVSTAGKAKSTTCLGDTIVIVMRNLGDWSCACLESDRERLNGGRARGANRSMRKSVVPTG